MRAVTELANELARAALDEPADSTLAAASTAAGRAVISATQTLTRAREAAAAIAAVSPRLL